MNQAQMWSKLREMYLGIVEDFGVNEYSKELIPLLKKYAPQEVSDRSQGGDQGWVYFSDHSEILYDWDNGDFQLGDVRLSYPYSNDDPLYFER